MTYPYNPTWRRRRQRNILILYAVAIVVITSLPMCAIWLASRGYSP